MFFVCLIKYLRFYKFVIWVLAKTSQDESLWRWSLYVYGFKIYEGTTLIQDYVPVLDSNDRPCLFDKVSKTCFYNQGTGEFLYG